jgi:hypothetical protein
MVRYNDGINNSNDQLKSQKTAIVEQVGSISGPKLYAQCICNAPDCPIRYISVA